MSCGVGCRCGSDSTLLWLWRRPVATVPIRTLVWEPPNAVEAALETAKRQKKEFTKIPQNFLTLEPLIISHSVGDQAALVTWAGPGLSYLGSLMCLWSSNSSAGDLLKQLALAEMTQLSSTCFLYSSSEFT